MIRLIIEALVGGGLIAAGVAAACAVGVALARIPLREIRRPERPAQTRTPRADERGVRSLGDRRRTAVQRAFTDVPISRGRQRRAISPALVGSKAHAPK